MAEINDIFITPQMGEVGEIIPGGQEGVVFVNGPEPVVEVKEEAPVEKVAVPEKKSKKK